MFSQDKDKILLVDLNPLFPVPKVVPPIEQQLPNESQRFWNDLTQAILTKQYSQATVTKQEIEERQRQKASERKARNVEWKSRFFTSATSPSGRPEMTDQGKLAMQKLNNRDWQLEPTIEV